MKGFQAVYQYLEDFKKDLNNPKYIQKLVYENAPVEITPLSNETIISKYFNTEICRFNPFTCTSKLKIEQYKLEIQYIDKVFHTTCRKFLTAIDHTIILHRYTTPPELREVKNMLCMDIATLILEP